MIALALAAVCLSALIGYTVGARRGFERGYLSALLDRALAEEAEAARFAEYEGQINAAREGRN